MMRLKIRDQSIGPTQSSFVLIYERFHAAKYLHPYKLC